MATMDLVPEKHRQTFVRRLLEEVRQMDDDELAMLLLHGMDDGEVNARVDDIITGVTSSELTCQ